MFTYVYQRYLISTKVSRRFILNAPGAMASRQRANSKMIFVFQKRCYVILLNFVAEQKPYKRLTFRG